MSLSIYRQKRDFKRSPEPHGRKSRTKRALLFVVQKHASRRLHFDFRLELDGVFKSWAVPKGPSMDPSVKRLAVAVDDHPLDYGKFEGRIPEGSYGAGDVEIWDHGTYHAPETAGPGESGKLLRKGLEKGHLEVVLRGKRFKGGFTLVRTHLGGDRNWLLIKRKDDFTESGVSPEEKEYERAHAAREAAREAGRKNVTPATVEPMLANLVKEPFSRRGWLFEIKWDGYRAIAQIDRGKAGLYSRNGISFAGKFPDIERELATLKVRAVLDGELVVLDDQGRSRFHLLQHYLKTGDGTPQYQVFDLLELDQKDLRNYPLFERKALLQKTVAGLQNIRYCDHVQKEGIAFMAEARKQGLEGVMAKRAKSLYKEGKRSWDWLKIKVPLRQEAVICGFTAPKGSRRFFGALILGVYEGKELIFAGLCGAGFSHNQLQEIKEKLDSLIQEPSPFRSLPKIRQGPVTWVTPKLVCEIAFTERTTDGLFRHPSFAGLR